MSEAYDAAKSVSVLLMGINQKQLIAVSILNRKIILDVGLPSTYQLNVLNFIYFFSLTELFKSFLHTAWKLEMITAFILSYLLYGYFLHGYVSVLLMGINQKQLIAVSILNRKIILDVGLRRETSLNAIDFQLFLFGSDWSTSRLNCACCINSIHISTKCVEFHLFLFVYRVIQTFLTSGMNTRNDHCFHYWLFAAPWLGWSWWNIWVTNDHEYVPLVLNTFWSFPYDWSSI
jgi:hypothetical protein